MLDASYYQKTDEIIAMHTREERSLIPIIQDIQEEYRYLPPELLTYVAKQIGITEAKAYSVASFYENFSFEAKGKYVIKVCDGTACHVRKSIPILEGLYKELGLVTISCDILHLPYDNKHHKVTFHQIILTFHSTMYSYMI